MTLALGWVCDKGLVLPPSKRSCEGATSWIFISLNVGTLQTQGNGDNWYDRRDLKLTSEEIVAIARLKTIFHPCISV